MSYVIRRTDGRGGYVARPGSTRAYTDSKRSPHVHVYPTREAAEADRCPENEVVEAL